MKHFIHALALTAALLLPVSAMAEKAAAPQKNIMQSIPAQQSTDTPPRETAVPAEHRQCKADGDCGLVLAACTKCCATPEDYDAVNTAFTDEHQNPHICTPEHIRACGVPECGLALIVTKPVAVCRENICVVESVTEDHREDAGSPE